MNGPGVQVDEGGIVGCVQVGSGALREQLDQVERAVVGERHAGLGAGVLDAALKPIKQVVGRVHSGLHAPSKVSPGSPSFAAAQT